MEKSGEKPASTMAPEDLAKSDDDSASQSSLDSFEMDDSHMTEEPYMRPGWQQHHPAQDMNFEATSRTDPSTLAIYKNLVILNADSNEASAPWIRLLRIEAGQPGHPIHCTLLKHQLWEDREYSALSWSWGQQPRSRTISINAAQIPFSVTEHLWTALDKLRSTYSSTTIWIDAICIDQENFVERAAQVGIMAQIYNGASKVMVWLGSSGHPQGQTSMVERFSSLCNQSSPWWKRLWVVQECAYAQACPLLMIDDDQISMRAFIRILDDRLAHSNSLGNTLSGRPGSLSANLELLRMPFEAWMTGTERNRHRMPLVERLRQTSGRECKDPRDRIYALLGLIDEVEARLIKPDYRKSYPDLLLDVAQALDHYPYSSIKGCESALDELIEEEDLISSVLERRAWLRQRNAPLAAISLEQHRSIKKDIQRVGTDASFVRVVKTLLESYPNTSARKLLWAAWEYSGIVGLFDLWPEHDVQAHLQKALYLAADSDQAVIVGQLLKIGADPNGVTITRKTPLCAASKNGSMEVVKLLLEHSTDANRTSAADEEPTALSAAVRHQHLKIVQLLLQHGAEVNARCGSEGNVLCAAMRVGDTEMLRLLLEALEAKANPNAVIKKLDARDALYSCIEQGRVDIVRLLLDHGADPNVVSGQHSSPLCAEAARGDYDLVSLLLERKDDISLGIAQVFTALCYAVKTGSSEAVHQLLKTGVNPSMECGTESTLRCLAVERGNLGIFKLLLAYHADPDLKIGGGSSALQVASREGFPELLELLLRKAR